MGWWNVWRIVLILGAGLFGYGGCWFYEWQRERKQRRRAWIDRLDWHKRIRQYDLDGEQRRERQRLDLYRGFEQRVNRRK